MSLRVLGNVGEEFAKSLLLRNGYKILTRNFRTRFGEIDIVAVDDDTLVFVEVKTRRNSKFGEPEEAASYHKLSHIKKAAQYYLLRYKIPFKKQRIDVVSLLVENGTVKSSKIIKLLG